jgi:general secretion pathway protein C
MPFGDVLLPAKTSLRERALSKWGPRVATLALVLVLAFELAQLTWQLLPGAPPLVTVQTPSAAPAALADASPKFEALLGAHLFGEAPAEAGSPQESVAIVAPDTTLAVTLKGILYGEHGAASTAVIETSRGREDAYGIGDTLEGTNALLRAVYADHVVLERDGRLEALRQPRDPAPTAAPPPEADLVTDEQGPDDAENADAEPAEDPGVPDDVDPDAALTRVAEVFQMTPKVEGDELKGFVVNPGSDPQTFEALGFQAGDVITAIEDMSLEDVTDAGALLERFATARVVRVVVTRNGQPQQLAISTAPLRAAFAH